MTTKFKDAIAAVAAALEAYDWQTYAETEIAIDTTAGKQWEAAEIHALETPLCYVSRISRSFSELNRVRWNGSPVVAVTVIYSVEGDAAGQPNQDRFDLAEAVLEQTANALDTELSDRFAVVEMDQPVAYDDERMASLIYVSQIVFTLSDKVAAL